MANRVTPAEVYQIYDYSTSILDADAIVLITAANQLVNNISGLTAAQLKEIERWLGAHMVAIRDPQSDTEKAGPVSQKYQNKVDLNFNQTRYGQMALVLDTTGYLASLQSQAEGKGTATASLVAMGPMSDDDIDNY